MNVSINKETIKNNWNKIKQGEKVLMANIELDILNDEIIPSLTEYEQNLYYNNFKSLFKKELQLGLLSRCFECWI